MHTGLLRRHRMLDCTVPLAQHGPMASRTYMETIGSISIKYHSALNYSVLKLVDVQEQSGLSQRDIDVRYFW